MNVGEAGNCTWRRCMSRPFVPVSPARHADSSFLHGYGDDRPSSTRWGLSRPLSPFTLGVAEVPPPSSPLAGAGRIADPSVRSDMGGFDIWLTRLCVCVSQVTSEPVAASGSAVGTGGGGVRASWSCMSAKVANGGAHNSDGQAGSTSCEGSSTSSSVSTTSSAALPRGTGKEDSPVHPRPSGGVSCFACRRSKKLCEKMIPCAR